MSRLASEQNPESSTMSEQLSESSKSEQRAARVNKEQVDTFSESSTSEQRAANVSTRLHCTQREMPSLLLLCLTTEHEIHTFGCTLVIRSAELLRSNAVRLLIRDE